VAPCKSITVTVLPQKKIYIGYMAKFMFVKRFRYQKLDVLTEFFKYAGQLYDPLLLNDHPNYESDESGIDTDDE